MSLKYHKTHITLAMEWVGVIMLEWRKNLRPVSYIHNQQDNILLRHKRLRNTLQSAASRLRTQRNNVQNHMFYKGQ